MKDLTQGSIKKHIIELSIPSIMGSLFATLYNVVDTFWAGKVSQESSSIMQTSVNISKLLSYSGDIRALTGMSVSFPIFLVMLALSIGLHSSTIALMGNAIGRKDSQMIDRYLTQAMLYALACSSLLLMVLPLLPVLLKLLGAKEAAVIEYAKAYIGTIIMGNVLFSLSFVFSAALIARGDTKTQRNIDIVTFFLNIVLDPLLLFGWGPIPAMGLRGIALATLIAQLLKLVFMYAKLRNYRSFEHITKNYFYPQWGTLGLIAKQSLPPTLNMVVVSFLLGMVNRYASIYGGIAAVAAYGISLRIEQIVLIPSMGVSTALTSIASQNNGAGQIRRIRQAYGFTLLMGMLLLLVVMLPLGLLFSQVVVRLFTADSQTVEIAIQYLGICVLTFFPYLLMIFSSSIFQAMQVPHYASYLTISRNCLLPLITFHLFPVTFGLGLQGLWLAILFNNVLVACITLYLCLRILRKALGPNQ